MNGHADTGRPMIDDRAIEAMLGRRAGGRLPDELLDGIVAAVRVTRQPRTIRRTLADLWPAGRGRRIVLLAATVALLAALVAGAILAGARLLQRSTFQLDDPKFQPALIEILGGPISTRRVVGDRRDPVVWALADGGLDRYEPRTGATSIWTTSTDERFSAQEMLPARAGGVWLLDRTTVRRFDGTAFREKVELAGDVLAVAEAPDGSLWVGLNDKLDGRLVHVTPAGSMAVAVPRPDASLGVNLAGIASTRITALAVDEAGSVWCGWSASPAPQGDTYAYVSRFDGTSWAWFGRQAANPLGNEVRGMTTLRGGGVLVTTDGGFARSDGGAWRDLTVSWPTVADGPAAEAPDGSLWIAENARIWHLASDWTPTALTGVPSGSGIAGSPAGTSAGVTAVDAPDGSDSSSVGLAVVDGVVLDGTQTGLYRLSNQHWEQVLPDTAAIGGGSDPGSHSVVALGRDDAWLAVGTSVWHRHDGTLEQEPAAPHEVMDLILTADGTPWIATSAAETTGEAGVFRLVDGAWQPVEGTPDGIGGLAVGPDGRVWVGGYQNVLTVAPDGTQVTSLPVSGQILAADVVVQPHGTVWMAGNDPWGSRGGLAVLRDRRWESVQPTGVTEPFAVMGLAIARDGSLWVCGRSFIRSVATGATDLDDWVAHYDGTSWTTWSRLAGIDLEDQLAWGVAAPPDGGVVVATTGGLARWDGTTWSSSLPGLTLYDVSVAPDGATWVNGSFGVGRVVDPSDATKP
jgi:hypothetical protein